MSSPFVVPWVALAHVAAAVACVSLAYAGVAGPARVAALICVLLVAVGAGVYLARGFGGFVLMASGYAAATGLLVAMAALAAVRHSRTRAAH